MSGFALALSEHKALQDRIDHSRRFLSEVRSALSKLRSGTDPNICMFAVGSLGRFEAGRQSDLDVFVLPVENVTRVTFVLNLRTAREIEVAVPPAMLVRFDRVIE